VALSFLAVPRSDYERFRKRLEEQLRADVELLYEGYRAKLRAYEMVARLRGDFDGEFGPPLELARSLSPVPGPAQLPAAPAASPPAPAPPRRGKAYELFNTIFDLLATLPEVFDKSDLVRALGYEPRRTTLHNTLELLLEDGLIEVAQHGTGKRLTRYRRIAPPPAVS
jgi:hypothetical protein